MQPNGAWRCQKQVGMLLSNFQRSLAAVIVGNLIYFALFPVLPPALRHGITRFGIGKFDWGLLIDFGICTVLYIVMGHFWPAKKQDEPKPHP